METSSALPTDMTGPSRPDPRTAVAALDVVDGPRGARDQRRSVRPTPLIVGSLSNPEADADAESRARSLRLRAQTGAFGPALEELNAAPTLGPDAPELVAELRDTVAHELTRRVVDLYEELNLHPHALHALGVAPASSEQMVVVPEDRRLHLIERRVAHGDVISEELHTACGQELWSDLDAPLAPGMRGSWQQPELFEVTRCTGCAAHASRFAAAQERFEDPDLPNARGDAMRDEVSGAVRAQLSEQMSDIAHYSGVEALQAAEARYRDTLTETLVAEARAGGDEVLKRILLRYYDTARRNFQRVGAPTASLSALVSEEQWRQLVAGLLEDIHEAGNGPAAQSHLFADLRSIIRKQLVNEQLRFVVDHIHDAGQQGSET